MTAKERKYLRSKKGTLALVAKVYGRNATILHRKFENTKKDYRGTCVTCGEIHILKHSIIIPKVGEVPFCSLDCLRENCMDETQGMESKDFIISEYRSEYLGPTVGFSDGMNHFQNSISGRYYNDP